MQMANSQSGQCRRVGFAFGACLQHARSTGAQQVRDMTILREYMEQQKTPL